MIAISFKPSAEKPLSEVTGSYTYFEDNDVILAKVTPCFENGKAGVARNLKNGIGFGSSEFYVLRCHDGVLPEWVYFCVTHAIFRVSAIAQMTGTGGLQRVPRSFVEDFEIPLPPLDVQKTIVAEIERHQNEIAKLRDAVSDEEKKIQIAIASVWEDNSVEFVLVNMRNGLTAESISQEISQTRLLELECWW